MVDCRGAASPLELNSGNNSEHGGASGDAGSGRASTPAQAPPYPPHTMQNGGAGPQPMMQPAYCGPLPCMSKQPLVWLGPPPPALPPPHPHPLPPHVAKSVQPNGADLPMNDIPTLRFYFNLGVDCMWSGYGGAGAPPGPPPQPPPHPHKHYSPRDLAQDMQQMSIQGASGGGGGGGAPREPHDHKKGQQGDKGNNKGGAQRPLLGPRFKRNHNGDNNNSNSGPPHQNKGHNNKGPNNRYDNRRDPAPRPEEPLVAVPYTMYPPPMYPVPYYPVENEPQMMGMMNMGGMGYMGYEEGLEYPMVPYYFAPAPPPQHLPHVSPPTGMHAINNEHNWS